MTLDIHKLLFISDAPQFGGAERYVADMALAASRRGIASVVCWIRPPSAPADVFDMAERAGARLCVIDKANTRSLGAWWRTLRHILRCEQPDAAIINACGRPRFWLSTWAARQQGIPAAWVHHMVDSNDYRLMTPSRAGGRVEGLHVWRWPQALRHRLAASAATTVIALNEQDRLQVAREQCIRPQRIEIVPNGIDIARYEFNAEARQRVRAGWLSAAPAELRMSFSSAEPFIIGTAGRLVSGKGILMLIEAALVLRKRGVPALIMVAGEGPQLLELRTYAQQLGIADAICFAGFVQDMPAFYSGLDVFVLCSQTESFGLVLTEAMACGRAVVATPTAGARAQIDHGRSGYLLESHAMGELVETLWDLYRSPAQCEQVGQSARQHVVADFSINRTLERTLQLLATPKRKPGNVGLEAWGLGSEAPSLNAQASGEGTS